VARRKEASPHLRQEVVVAAWPRVEMLSTTICSNCNYAGRMKESKTPLPFEEAASGGRRPTLEARVVALACAHCELVHSEMNRTSARRCWRGPPVVQSGPKRWAARWAGQVSGVVALPAGSTVCCSRGGGAHGCIPLFFLRPCNPASTFAESNRHATNQLHTF